MILASADLMEHVSDHAWPGCVVEVFGMPVTLMSSGIATMLLAGLGVSVLFLLAGRRAARLGPGEVPHGLVNVAEVIVVFVRDMIARPALHDRAYAYLPFLLTLFVFILGINLFGLIPLESLSVAVGLPPMGVPATSIATVCVGFGLITLVTILGAGLKKAAYRTQCRRGWSPIACLLLSPVLWFFGLSPHIEGVIGRLMLVPLALLELVGVLAKSFSLMVRLCANILSGHTLLGVMMMFILQTLAGFLREQSPHLFYVGPACILASALVSVLELLVAGLQAYIFTFLSAMFIGLYAEGEH